MTEREQLLAMLKHAEASRHGAKLEVTQPSATKVAVFTGPDDAVAFFGFTPGGMLKTVSVDES